LQEPHLIYDIRVEARKHLAMVWIYLFFPNLITPIEAYPTIPVQTLDALHLAVAFANHLTLATADSHIAESAKNLGIAVELL